MTGLWNLLEAIYPLIRQDTRGGARKPWSRLSSKWRKRPLFYSDAPVAFSQSPQSRSGPFCCCSHLSTYNNTEDVQCFFSSLIPVCSRWRFHLTSTANRNRGGKGTRVKARSSLFASISYATVAKRRRRGKKWSDLGFETGEWNRYVKCEWIGDR